MLMIKILENTIFEQNIMDVQNVLIWTVVKFMPLINFNYSNALK